MRKQYLLFLLAFLCAGFYSYAQTPPTNFSENPDELLKQLTVLFEQTKLESTQKTFEEFSKSYKTGKFSAEEQRTVSTTLTLMQQQKLNTTTNFPFYLSIVNDLKKLPDAEKAALRFKKWHEIYAFMLNSIEKRRLKPLEDFMDFSKDFFAKNALFSGEGWDWIVKADAFDLSMEQKTPIFTLKKTDLLGVRGKDTIVVKEVSGTYFPLTGVLKASEGKATWERLKLGTDVYCKLTNYTIDLKKNTYECADAALFYPQFFPKGAVKGMFHDKIVSENLATGNSYPRFETNDKKLKLDLGNGIQYEGGFRLQGATVVGYGDKENKASVKIFGTNNNLKFKGFAELFSIKKGEKMTGERVISTMYFETDSIFHPAATFRYDIPKKKIQLYRGDSGDERNPFFDSFHKVNMNVEKMDWNLQSDSITIGTKIPGIVDANTRVGFESLDFFQEGDYRRMQSVSSYSPIATLKSLAEATPDRRVRASDLASRLGANLDVTSINNLLYDLTSKGFVTYDAETKIISVKDKTFHYADANQKKVDYDGLNIISESDSTNAVFYLKRKDKGIAINGVPSVELSAAQKVGLVPNKSKINLLQNRRLAFDGKAFAGFSSYTGTKFQFNYDRFQLEMDSIQFFDLFLPTGGKSTNGKPELKAISSRIENLKGVLLIDAPDNKSSKEQIGLFPSFNSKGFAYVYYDAKDIQNGSYKRDSFYFKLDKFGFNALDELDERSMKFKGTMVSADIFPDFKETLLLQADKSLGFTHKTPTEGYALYRKKGNFLGEVQLSNVGFLGKGRFSYFGADVNSEDIIFKPKQLLATAKAFNLKEDRASAVQVPQTTGIDVAINWKPYRDSMYVTSQTAPFDLFKSGEHTLKGTIILTPTGVKGNGLLDWSRASIQSKYFAFGAYSLKTDTSDLKIKAIGGNNDLAFDTRGLRSDVDFDTQKGVFKAVSKNILAKLPFVQYRTTMNEFDWDMKNETVTFKAINGLANFTSTHPNKDSLHFKGNAGFYNLRTNEFKVGGVPHIISADAFIYPDSGKVEINGGGEMSTLKNAKIICDTINKHHIINRVTADVKGRKDFTARGFYEYNIGNRKQEIDFQNIIGQRVGKGNWGQKPVLTTATGEVKPEDHFYIDQKTEFRGTISLRADNKNLRFEGYAQLDMPILPNRHWFLVSFDGDRTDLAIRYHTPKNYEGEPLETGIFLSKEMSVVYPRILMPLFIRKDRAIFAPKGYMKYSKATDEFVFADSTRTFTKIPKGDRMTVSAKDGSIFAEGKLNFCSEAKGIAIKSFGRIKTKYYQPEPSDTTEVKGDKNLVLDAMMGIKMPLPSKLLNIMLNDMKAGTFDAKDVEFGKDDFYEKNLPQFIPNEAKIMEAVGYLKQGAFNVPDKNYDYSLFFAKVPLIWNQSYQSFLSKDNKIALAHINGEYVGKMVDAFIEYKMPSNGEDRMYLYLKTPTENYYYFGYQQGILSVISNNPKFNQVITGMKKKELTVKGVDGTAVEIQLAGEEVPQLFVRRAQAGKTKN
jgi:hypothetical protein